MRYIIIGAGGMGGVIGGFLAANNQDIALIARGAHLAAIQENGLIINSALGGKMQLKPIEAHAATEDFEPGDVVFVCVKGYSLLETVPVISKVARPGALVIPILNSLTAGQKLQQALPQLTVLDGCIYTSAFISAPGIIEHPGTYLRIVFGARTGQQADGDKLAQVAADLQESSIDGRISSHIEVDMFKKFAFISTFASTDSYFDVDAGAIQQEGEPRQLMENLLYELVGIAQAQGLPLEGDLFADTMAIVAKTAPEITTSMHKDVLAHKNLETQELIFDVVEMAAKLGLETPHYLQVARHFGYQG